MKVDDVIDVWNKWGIRAVVLLSFILQIFLLVLGEIRRRSSSTTLRVFLWLAYLLADSTAIYALGHLSVISGPREHQLVAFWAPFLLLHLGGPDNITAYALEDNSLWLRHLQTLVVQVLGAAYVIYLYMSSSEILLLLGASIAMFVAGLVKYGERIWALYCGNISNIRDNFIKTDHEVNPLRFVTAGTSRTGEVLLKAHYNFSVCQSVFLDTTLEPGGVEPAGLGPINVGVEIYKLVELELSLMYDILYTKAPVIHTRYGFCIRFISLIGTSIAFCLFQLSISSSTGSGYSFADADVIISYVLLVGALTLEVISLCRVALSSWIYFHVYCKAQPPPAEPTQLFRIWARLRWLAQPTSRRQWRDSIGQYNLFHLCTRDRTELGTRLAMKMGMEDWWNKMHFSGTFSGTDSLSVQHLKEIVLQNLLPDRTGMHSVGGRFTCKDYLNSRGRIHLQRWSAYRDIAEWSMNIDFDESILVWHIATDVFVLLKNKFHRGFAAVPNESRLIEATTVLSNYMMFLLVEKPDMLPGRTHHNLYLDICKQSEIQSTSFTQIESLSSGCAERPSPRSCNWYYRLKKNFQRDPPNYYSRIQHRERLANRLYESVRQVRAVELSSIQFDLF
ncbi:hypothetical protein PR202_gb24073 [Eleusine coracana subsp. coracana]|uniref:DUF4220 domain-containing protein n=1 Tax=Eleusine coracana subsp. coracana TaxID=191504 RepID=A0AAV5FKR6_ELECO|nr:hypothetical protein PR202_gb24073 [Eleusine coracana subsp. coracana]